MVNTNYKVFLKIKGGMVMVILRCIGGFVVLFWLIGLIFRIGGSFINMLLIFAAVVLILDTILGKRKAT